MIYRRFLSLLTIAPLLCLATAAPASDEAVLGAYNAFRAGDPDKLARHASSLKGHTLEVFRLDPIPAKSMYLGTIRILEVRPNEAVGQPIARPRVPIEKGDRVASRIALGS